MLASAQGRVALGKAGAGGTTKRGRIKEKKGTAKVTPMKFRLSKHCPAVSYWAGDFESSECAGGQREVRMDVGCHCGPNARSPLVPPGIHRDWLFSFWRRKHRHHQQQNWSIFTYLFYFTQTTVPVGGEKKAFSSKCNFLWELLDLDVFSCCFLLLLKN